MLCGTLGKFLGRSTASLSITIIGANDAPVANGETLADQYQGIFALAGTARTVAAGVLTANDSDIDQGDSVSLLSTDLVSTHGATIAYDTLSGTFSYDSSGVADFQILAEGETVTDSFTYTIADSYGATATATATVVVGGNAQAPISVDDNFDLTTVVGPGVMLDFDNPFEGFGLTSYWGVNYSYSAYLHASGADRKPPRRRPEFWGPLVLGERLPRRSDALSPDPHGLR